MRVLVLLIVINFILGAVGWGFYIWERWRRKAAQTAILHWQKVFNEWKQTAEIWQESAYVWQEASKIWRQTAETYQRTSDTWRDLYLQNEETKDDESLIN